MPILERHRSRQSMPRRWLEGTQAPLLTDSFAQPVANNWKLLYPIGSNPAWINPIRPHYPVEYLLTFRHRVFRPASLHRLVEEPCWAARPAIARHVEQWGEPPAHNVKLRGAIMADGLRDRYEGPPKLLIKIT
jgi:hypothetical protein